jgi:hypothetical protein
MADAATQHPLGLDRPANVAALGIGVGSLFVSGFDAQVALLLAQLAVTATGNRWDASETGQIGALARLARSASRLSAQAAVLALIDDADDLDPDLALLLLANLMFRDDGQMLIVVAADRPCARGLSPGWLAGYSPLGLIQTKALTHR